MGIYISGTGVVPPLNVSNNQVFRIQLVGCGIVTGDKYDADVTVGYKNDETGLANNAIGSIRGRAG